MKTAVCVVVKNEEADLAEWLAYYAVLGFDTAIVLDNNSTDATAAVVKRAATVQDIRGHLWTNATPQFQTDAYLAVCRLYAAEFDWIAFVDADEFLVLHRHTLASWLGQFDRPGSNAAAIAVPWAVFGSNGHDAAPEGLTIEAFTRRASAGFPPNKHVKSVVRPGLVRGFVNCHHAEVAGPFLGPFGQCIAFHTPGVLAQPPDLGEAQINHYFCRSRSHWQARLARQTHARAPRTQAEFEAHDRNDVEDLSAARIAPLVREQMRRFADMPPPHVPAPAPRPSVPPVWDNPKWVPYFTAPGE